MNTLRGEGPLDAARRVNNAANAIDDMIGGHSDLTPLDIRDVSEMLDNLDHQHPFLGEEVIIYGQQLTMGLDDDGEVIPFLLQPDQENTPLTGNYAGFAHRRVFDPKSNEYFGMVVHAVHIGDEEYFDEFLNPVTKKKFDYVCVQGSEVFPVLPYKAHSLYELRNDRVAGEVDMHAFDDSLGPVEKLTAAEIIINGMLREENYDERMRQRISYINSLGLLDDIVLVTRDYVIVGGEGSVPPATIDENSSFSDLSSVISFRPSMLYPSPGYGRRPDGSIETCLSQRSYAAAVTEENNIILASTANAISIVSSP